MGFSFRQGMAGAASAASNPASNFIVADAPAHAARVELNLNLASFSPYLTYTGSGCGFGGNGSGSGSLVGTKKTCIAGAGGTAAYASISAIAVGPLVIGTMNARTRTPTGLDTAQFTIN